VITIEKKLEKNLYQQEPLTLDQLRFIVREILPLISQLPPGYVERLEQRLREDIMRKRSTYDKRAVDSVDSLSEINETKNIDIYERIRKYLIMECGLEYAQRSHELFKKMSNNEIEITEYDERVNELYEKIYSFCPCSPEERDFVRRPYQLLPIRRSTNEFVEKVIEPKIEKLVKERMKNLEILVRKST